MIRKSTYILLIILLILGAVIVFLQRAPGLISSSSNLPTSTPSILVANWPGRSIVAFDMSDDKGHVLSASLGSDSTWQVTQPAGCTVDSGSITTALSGVNSLKVSVELKAPAALADVGLLSPTYRLTATMDDGSIQKLSVGSVVPTGTGYYVQLNLDPVVAVSKFSIDSIFNLVGTACGTPTP